MGERDERIETLKSRQEEMKGRIGGLNVEYRDLTNAPQGDSTPEQLDQRSEDIGALTSERTALESELGATEGELGELEAGEREDARRRDATESGPTPSTDDTAEITSGLSPEGEVASQSLPDQNPSDTVTQESAQELTEAAKTPREDWEKISAEQEMHKGQMTELRETGNEVVANMNFASSDVGQETYRSATGADMTDRQQRGFEKEAYSSGVDQLNSLFAAHDQQRQAFYGSNTAENPKVREQQMENRAAMDKEMNGLRYEIVEKEVCALEARKAVDFRNENAVSDYRDRMARQGQSQATMDARENDYRELLSKDKASEVKDMTEALHRDHFPTVPDHIRVLEPAHANEQPGLPRAPEEHNTPSASASSSPSGGGPPGGPPSGGGPGGTPAGAASSPAAPGATAPSATVNSASPSVPSSDQHAEWHKIEAENQLQQRQIDEMMLAKGKVVSDLASKAAEMGTTPTYDQLKDFYSTSTKGFEDLKGKFKEHDAQMKALQDGNLVEDPALRKEQMQNRDMLDHSTHVFRYEATRDIAETVAKNQVERNNAELVDKNTTRLESKGATDQQIETSNNALKERQEADRKADELQQTNTVHAQHCPELAANPPVLAQGVSVGGAGGPMAPQQAPPGGGGAGGGAPAQAGPGGGGAGGGGPQLG